MLNYLIQSLMRQLQSKNAPGFQRVETMMAMKQNPEPYIKQMLSNMSSEQKQSLFKQCKQYNVPDSILSQLQNMK